MAGKLSIPLYFEIVVGGVTSLAYGLQLFSPKVQSLESVVLMEKEQFTVDPSFLSGAADSRNCYHVVIDDYKVTFCSDDPFWKNARSGDQLGSVQWEWASTLGRNPAGAPDNMLRYEKMRIPGMTGSPETQERKD